MRATSRWMAAGLAVTVFACGGGGGGTPPSSAPATGKKLTIAVIPKGTTHEFWKSVHAGAAKGAKENNVSILWKGPLKEDDLKSQVDIVESMIA